LDADIDKDAKSSKIVRIAKSGVIEVLRT